MNEAATNSIERLQSAWWREREFLVVLALAAVTYCVRVDALPLFGEEPRRALIAREMVQSGDWLVPGTQRIFLPSRPPLQNWLIAFASYFTGSFDVWAARLPSILATFGVAVLIYGYLRQQISSLGCFAGSCAYLTMLHVMEFGRSAETEAVFTLFVSASMLLWHWGWLKQWPAWKMWSIGYGCAALGMLTKGLQAPVYFVGGSGLFLLSTGNWRALLTRGHLVGILTFCLVFGSWQAPFTWYRGVADSWDIYFGDVAGRFVDRTWQTFLEHLVAYPLQLLGVSLMPWSVLLLALGSRQIRRRLQPIQQSIIFLTVCILFSIIFVWLPPGSKVRYYMPLFPCFAALIGIAVEGMAIDQRTVGRSPFWSSYVRLSALIMMGASVGIMGTSVLRPDMIFSLPILAAAGFAIAAASLAFVSWHSSAQFTRRGMSYSISSIATFFALVELCLVLTVQQRRCEDIAGQIDELKRELPTDVRLVSLGPVHHAFAFFYERPIPVLSLQDEFSGDNDYFCLHTYDAEPPQLPFAWTKFAVISCDRLKGRVIPKDRVFIGHRLPIQQVGMQSLDSTSPRSIDPPWSLSP